MTDFIIGMLVIIVMVFCALCGFLGFMSGNYIVPLASIYLIILLFQVAV